MMIEDCTEISDCEKKLSPLVRNVNLLSEIILSRNQVDKLGALIKKEISADIKQGIEHLEKKFPTCLACFLVWKGILDYRDGNYWSAIRNSIDISDPNTQNTFGDIFIKFLKLNSLMYFDIKGAHKNITPILAHGIIPNSCSSEYFENILLPFVEELTYLDDNREIKFWLESRRQNDNEINNIEDEINELNPQREEICRNKARYESLIAIWDELEKIKELERLTGELNELNSLLEGLLDYYKKKQINVALQNEIFGVEEDLKHHQEKVKIFSEIDQIVLNHLNDIDQCGNILSELEIGFRELSELMTLRDALEEKIIIQAKFLFSEPWDNSYNKIIEQIPFDKLNKKVGTFTSVRISEISDEEKFHQNRFFEIFNRLVSYIKYLFKNQDIKKEQVLHPNEIQEMLSDLPIDIELFNQPDKLIQKLQSIKNDIEEQLLLNNRINSIETKNNECIQKIKDAAIIFGIDITGNIEQVVAVMHNQLTGVKEHKESAVRSEQTIKEVELNLSELIKKKLSLDDEIQEIEERFAYQGNGDVQSGIERIKRRQKALDDADSIRDALSKSYPDFDALQQEKIWADLRRKDKNHYILEIEKTEKELGQIGEKINDLNNKKNLIRVPFPYVDEPVRRFLLYGDAFAEKFLIESVLMVKLTKEGKGDSIIITKELPERIIVRFREWWRKQQYCLFCWDEVPGMDSEKFKNFLIQNYGIEWIISAKIEKIDDNTTIRVSNDNHFLLFKLNSEKTALILTIDDGTTDEFIVKMDTGRLKVYDSKPAIYFDEREIKVKFPPQHFNNLEDSACLIMNYGKPDYFEQYLKIYKNENLFETEEITFPVNSPSESYEFQLKIGDEIKPLNVVPGIITAHPFMAFEYDSKKLIKNSELPRRNVWIVSHESFKFKPEIPIIEEIRLTGKWSEYLAQAIDLETIERLSLCDRNWNEYPILIKTKNQDIEPELYGIKTEHANSNGKNIFIDQAPRIRIPLFSFNERKRYFIQIFPINSDKLTESKHFRFDDLSGVMHFDNQICEIPLSNEMCIGNAVGEFKVRVKNESMNVDKEFNFIILPRLELKFKERIYLPCKEQTPPVSLDFYCSKGLQFEPVEPAVTTNHKASTYFVKSCASEPCINGVMKYNFLSIPITIPIPRLTWQLEGVKSKKYLFETNEIGELSEEEWEYAVNDKLLLIVNVPFFVSGIAQLNLHNSIGQKSTEKINDGKAIFDMRIFTDTLRESTEQMQSFELTIIKSSELSLKDVLLFNVIKWQIKSVELIEKIGVPEQEPKKWIKEEKWRVESIECKRIRDGINQILEIKWKEIGYATDKILSLWQFNKKTIVHEVKLPSTCNIVNIKIDEKIPSNRNYLIRISSNDVQDSCISKNIYLLHNWNFLKNIKNIILMQHSMIIRLESRGDNITNLKNIYDEISIIKRYYDKLEESDRLPPIDPKLYFKKLVIEFKNDVERKLKERDDKIIRCMLGRNIDNM